MDEVEKFNRFDWWDLNGPAKWVHRYNDLRHHYIIKTISDTSVIRDHSSMLALDIGCGGGVLTERLARTFSTTGVDPGSVSIEVARKRATEQGLNIEYIQGTTKDLIAAGRKFDIIVASEVVEHIDDLDDFMHDLWKLSKPTTVVIITTINRTFRSWFSAILMGEYVLRLLPIGTHEFKKFVKPKELQKYFNFHNSWIWSHYVQGLSADGATYSLRKKKMIYTNSVAVNYMTALRPKDNSIVKDLFYKAGLDRNFR